jgi:HAD superfamily hydrolase (TIGR01509 family)
MSLLIFDCDGVLVDSESLLVTAVLAFLAEQGLPMVRSDYMARFMGLSASLWEQAIRRKWAEVLGCEPATGSFDALYQLVAETMASELTEVTGARQTLCTLPGERCVVSNSSAKGLRWKLAHTDLLALFDPHLYSSSLVSRPKPAPDLFLYVANQHQRKPSSCIVIEDSATGVLAAKRAGMKVIGFTAASHCLEGHGQALLEQGADCIVTRFEDLATALEHLSE